MKQYSYVGPAEILASSSSSPGGIRVGSQHDILAWIENAGQEPDHSGWYWTTYVVDLGGSLLLADRHSEHVACARGHPVLAAGELAMVLRAGRLEVNEVTNLSTGYCPEPQCWTAVATALERAGLDAPACFSHEIIFRRCPSCGQRNVVKDRWFFCAVCDSELPSEWNFGSQGG